MGKILRFLIIFFPTTCVASEPITHNFLVISDIHLNAKTTHKMQLAPDAHSIRNDLDLTTYLSFLKLSKQSIENKILSNPDFILLLGDLQGHKRYKNDVITSQSIIFKTISQTFPKTPIIYIFGNNDSPQKNYGEFSYNKISPYTIANKNIFLNTGVICKTKNIYPCLQEKNDNDGYFTAKLAPQLNLIGLNSVLFSINNNFQNKASTELSWLEKQLALAKQENTQAIIAMHIPPGDNIYSNNTFWRKDTLTEFIKIIDKYSNNIIGILTSHTHQEEIRILNTESAKIGIYSTPSLTTTYGNSPMLKSFFISKKNQKWWINNYVTYKFATQNKQLSLTKLYDFQSIYCLKQTNNINKCLNNTNIATMKITSMKII